MMKTQEVKERLRVLGYFDGPVDAELSDEYRAALRRFQRDAGTEPDGRYGPKTELRLLGLPIADADFLVGHPERSLRRWRLTYYYIGTDQGKTGARSIPMVDPEGKELALVQAATFVEAALEGTTRLKGGALLNVAHDPSYRRCDPRTYQPVFDIAKRQGWIPDKAGYAGLRTDGRQATHARTFEKISAGPGGFPVEHGIEMSPYRTLATDTGVLAKHDPTWKGKGGVIPTGTKVFVLELLGMVLPDGSTHDGWCVANDTGGGIYGAHADVFVGYKAYVQKRPIPDLGHIWFEGIEDKISPDYSYGL